MGLLLRAVRTLLAWLWAAVFWFAFLAVYLATFRAFPARWTAALTRFWGRSTLWIVGIRLVFENEWPFSEREPRVIVVNHQSTLDVIWGAAIVPPGFYAIGKKEVIFIPVLNVIWWALGFIRVDRGNTRKAVAALAGVAEAVNRGRRSLFISPEGTRSPDGTMQPFKKGAFHIAIQAQAPICPVIVHGAYELMNKREFTPRPGVLRLRFLEPIPTAGLTTADIPKLVETVYLRMFEAFEEQLAPEPAGSHSRG